MDAEGNVDWWGTSDINDAKEIIVEDDEDTDEE